jgi:hypothetical protein
MKAADFPEQAQTEGLRAAQCRHPARKPSRAILGRKVERPLNAEDGG